MWPIIIGRAGFLMNEMDIGPTVQTYSLPQKNSGDCLGYAWTVERSYGWCVIIGLVLVFPVFHPFLLLLYLPFLLIPVLLHWIHLL